ncbi:hypothetical protein BB561_006958, partial [Smittium simulii]
MGSAETTKESKKVASLRREESQTQEGTTDQSPVHAAGQNQEEILFPAADRSPDQQKEKDKDSQENPKEEIREIVQILSAKASKNNFYLLSSYIPTKISSTKHNILYQIFSNTTTNCNILNNRLNYIPLTEPNDLYETVKDFNKNFITKITNILKIADIPENTINKINYRTSSLYNVLLEHQHHRYEARKKIPQSIKNIVQNGKIKVINADKNLGPSVVNTLAYHKKVLSILNNPQNYTLVTMTTEKVINRTLAHYALLKARIMQERELKNYRYIIKQEQHQIIPKFYILIKLHKLPIAFRPITSATVWITTNLSKLLAAMLINYQNKYILKNLLTLIKRIENINIPPNCVLGTMDV